MTAPTYATVEQLAAALDVDPSANATSRMYRALQTASRLIDQRLHRWFYPLTGTYTYHATPTSGSSGGGDRLELHAGGMWLDRDLLSLTSATVDGTAANTSTITYRPTAAPYHWVELTGSVIAITGVWGYSQDTNAAGALNGAVSDTTGVSVTVTNSAVVGIGDLITIDTERMIVTDRAMVDTTANITADVAESTATVSLTVNDGSLLNVGETILVDSERMLITDIASNTVTVVRAVDGSTLAAHTQPIDVYAPRTLTVERGATGSTAATHADAATITRNVPPEPIQTYTIAEAIMTISQETAGYGRTTVSGSELVEGLNRAKQAAAHYRRLRLAAV